ncbi:porin [uncultured Psychrobacter sp.]|uniref:porin n=1 Tax=uncultured Psychrobacter sp. TaxID=259303 RepID=UPI0034574A69
MKKTLSTLAITCLSVSAAFAEPTLSGRIFIIGNYVDGEFKDSNANDDNGIRRNGDFDGDTFEIESHKSSIGLEGSEPITAKTDVIYELEYDIGVDGESRTFESRSTYLGLANDNYGELRVGKYFSPIDMINNVAVTQGFWDNLGTTALSEDTRAVQALNMADAPPRVSNSVSWVSPKFDNLPIEVAFMYAASEDFSNGSGDENDTDNGYGSYLTYEQSGLVASLAYDKDIDIIGDLIRGTVTYDMSNIIDVPVTFGALYQQADYDNRSDKEKGFVISASLQLNNFSRPASIYVQYNNAANLDGRKDADSDQFVIGGQYDIKDNIIAHAYAGINKADDIQGVSGSDTTDIDSDSDNVVFGSGNTELIAIGGGLQYYF